MVGGEGRSGMKQRTFAASAWDRKGKVTRRERFLAEMDAVIPWGRLLALIEPHYPQAGNGTQPLPMEPMLRIYFMQQWFNLSDPTAKNTARLFTAFALANLYLLRRRLLPPGGRVSAERETRRERPESGHKSADKLPFSFLPMTFIASLDPILTRAATCAELP